MTSSLCKAVSSLFAFKVNSFSSKSTKCHFLPGSGNKVGPTTTWRACTTSSWATGTPCTYFQIPKLCFTWWNCLDGVYTFCASEIEIHSFCHQFVCRNIFSTKAVNDLWDVLLRPQNRCPLTSVSWISSSSCLKPHAIFQYHKSCNILSISLLLTHEIHLLVQIAFLHSLGCTVNPTSRLHASQLIEQYKTL
jgi:hypothetical protein